MRLELSPSPALAALIVAAHAAAGLAILAVLPGLAGIFLGCALLGLGAAAAWSRALLRSRGSVRAIELDGGALTLELAGGARLPAEVGARRYVTRLLVTLPLRAGTRRTLLVTRDMLGGGSFRALRLWALWGKLPGVAGKQLPA